MTNRIDMLFSLLRLSLNIDKKGTGDCVSVFVDAESEDWEEMFELSVRQGVLLLSYGGLQYLPEKSQPPRKIKLRWCVNVVKGSERYDYYKSIIAKLSNLLSKNNTPLLIMKGITISELYPVPYFRESGDIDIYFFKEAESANEILSSLGVRKEKEIPKHSTFIVDGIPIENHYTFFDTALQFQREGLLYQKMENILKGMFAEDKCRPLMWNNIYQLPPQAAALHLIGHTFRHFCCLDINIRQMCDWTVFFSNHKKDIDYGVLSYQINELGLNEFVCHINSFCSSYLGFIPYFMVPRRREIEAEETIMKIIVRYRLNPSIHIPIFSVLSYLFRRNNIYRRYLSEVKMSEFLLPEIKRYFAHLLKRIWLPANRKSTV
jgi:hypothetical protein